MPNFKYESLTAAGQTRSGLLSAADRADAVRQLLGRGETATRVVAADEPSGGLLRLNGQGTARPARVRATASPRGAGRPTLSRPELANLIRELATALEAGLPLMQALRTVRRQASGRGMPVLLDHLIERVEAGDPLHSAAREYGPPFTSMVVGMLRAADASGEVSEVLHQLADLLERQVELRREVLGATIYPMIVAGLIVISVIILVTVLVPRLIAPMAGQMTLPWPTRALLSVADFFQSYWIHMAVGLVVVAFAWRTWVASPANRLAVDRLKLRMPVMGQMLRDVAVAR
jgi:type II secretory pathway component PulF